MEKLFTPTEVAYAVGVCVQTIDRWYDWKNLNTGDEEAVLLPEPIRGGRGRCCGRRWTAADIDMLKRFKNEMVTGRNGKMGAITQKYVKKNA